jgi:ATP-dependent RNA helicase DDX46/PRP5
MSSSASDYSKRENKRHRSRSRKRGKDKISSRNRKHKRDSKEKKKCKYSSSSDSSTSYRATNLQKQRRKRKYDDEVDQLKGREIDKRREVEVKRKEDQIQKDEVERIKQQMLKKQKEKELTEDEKLEMKRKARLAKAKLMAILEKEEERKNENNINMDQLNEDFLQKDEPEVAEDVQMAEDKPPVEVVDVTTPADSEEDPLDAFMKTIENEATLQDFQISQMLYNQQLQRRYDEIAEKDGLEERQDTVMIVEDQDLNKIDESKIITYDEIFKASEPTQDDDEEFHSNFINTLKCVKAPDIDPLYGYSEEKKAIIIYQEDANEYMKEEEFDTAEDTWRKMKKMGEQKELKKVNHAEINYEPFRKNLYRESKEISKMTDKDVNALKKEMGDIKVKGKDIPRPIFNWYQCGLSDRILAVLEHKGFKEPFPIQCQAIPCLMSGRDVIGIAETGSGKTLAFVLPMLRHLLDQRALKVCKS